MLKDRTGDKLIYPTRKHLKKPSTAKIQDVHPSSAQWQGKGLGSRIPDYSPEI